MKIHFYLFLLMSLSFSCAGTTVVSGTQPRSPALLARSANISGLNNQDYRLQYNLVYDYYGNWSDHDPYWVAYYEFQNCYSYALEDVLTSHQCYDDFVVPGQLSNQTLSTPFTACNVAETVCCDLNALGYEVSISKREPLTLLPNQKMICTRVCDTDFHFMKMELVLGQRMWFQKFRESAPFQYLYHPSSMNWAVEKCWYNGGCFSAFDEYVGDIFYILYGETPFTYTSSEDTCEITGLKEAYQNLSSGIVEIPENINGKTVTGISNNAFQNNSYIEKAYIPSTVRHIGSNAFKNCENLSCVFFENADSAVSLGTDSFSNDNDVTIYAPTINGTEYSDAPGWQQVLSKLVEYSVINGVYCMPSYQESIFYGDVAEFVTCYNEYNYDVAWNPVLYDYNDPLIAYVLRYYTVLCSLPQGNRSIIEANVTIALAEGFNNATILLLDDEGEYVSSSTVINNVVTFDITSVLNGYGGGDFYLFPEEESSTIITFEPEDVVFSMQEEVLVQFLPENILLS